MPVPPSRPPHPCGMTVRLTRLKIMLGVVILVCSGCTIDLGDSSPAPESDVRTGFVRAEGRGLVVDGQPTRLKAVNFTNEYELDIVPNELLTSGHHSERDYERVKDLGFDSIRFAFKGDWYMEDPDSFWAWLDQNVEWARQHGVRLILDLHIPIGGYWLGSSTGAADFDMWTDDELRQQNIDLWASIAKRYREEPAVAAYDLLNEPVTIDSSGEQWRSLAQDIADAIRSVDQNHLLVVGAVYGMDGAFDPEGAKRHLLVDDDNVMYDFHFYDPYRYTHQFASWVPTLRDGGRYPDPDHLVPTTPPRVLKGNRIGTPSLPTGTSSWTEFDSGKVTLDERAATAASPQIVVEGGMSGTVHIDSIRVTEYDPSGVEIREVLQDQLTGDSTTTWFPWTGQDGGLSSVKHTRESSGHHDDASLSISGTVTSGAGWSSSENLFTVVPGNQYRIQGYMRGDEVTGLEGRTPRVGLQLELYGEQPDAPGDGFMARDIEYVDQIMAENLRFGAEHKVPMSVLEFGAVRHVFEIDGKGGDQWVSDVLTLLRKYDLSFAYWEYHGPEMGIYLDLDGEEGEPNDALQETLRRELLTDDD